MYSAYDVIYILYHKYSVENLARGDDEDAVGLLAAVGYDGPRGVVARLTLEKQLRRRERKGTQGRMH